MKIKQIVSYYINRIARRMIPFIYEETKYEGTFLLRLNTKEQPVKMDVPRIIYCFWTGNNPMSVNRKQALEILKKKTQCRVVLITPENLPEYILPEYPLHKAYNYLSLVHKSDYLRCYFMHHYGGGYTDIKIHEHSWVKAFDKLEKAPEKFISGYREIGSYAVARLNGNLGEDLKKNFSHILGNCSYIARAYSPFTNDWYCELSNRLDGYYDELRKFPGNVMGDNDGYPITWTGILGDIFHPLCLKYTTAIMFENSIKPRFKNYR